MHTFSLFFLQCILQEFMAEFRIHVSGRNGINICGDESIHDEYTDNWKLPAGILFQEHISFLFAKNDA